MRWVVRAPSYWLPGSATADLAGGTLVATQLLVGDDAGARCSGGGACYNFFLFRYRPGTNAGAAGARLLAAPLSVQRLHDDR